MCGAMAVSGHLLILLVPILSLCGATEYYVRSTEFTSTSCPAEPCLTLNQYTSDSDHYFKSNTVFKFLPGTHHMDRPLSIGNVCNMSLEGLTDESGEYPHLVTQFSCDTKKFECIPLYLHDIDLQVCCAAVWLYDVYNVTVKGISVTVQTSNITAVFLKHVSGTTVQLNTTCSLTNSARYEATKGIVIYEATSIEVRLSSTDHCSFGFMLINTTNANITNVTAMYNEAWGVYLYAGTDTNIDNTIAASNGRSGMELFTMVNTYITNTIAVYNDVAGMYLCNMNTTYITSMTTAHNSGGGMFLITMNNTHITNTTAAYNVWDGLFLGDMNNTYVSNTTTEHNSEHGMYLSDMNNTHITNVTTAENGEDGMILSNMNNTHITNMTTVNNTSEGMSLVTMNNTYITNTTAGYNDWDGMYLDNMNNTYISNMTTANNSLKGMCLSNMNNTHITNATVAHNGWSGITLSTMNNTHITSMTTANNNEKGIQISTTNNTYITDMTAENNGEDGMKISTANNTHINNVTTEHNGFNGMYLSNMSNTHISNATTAHNGRDGMELSMMSNTLITNTTAAYNDWYGMSLFRSINTCMTKTTATHNGLVISIQTLDAAHGQVVIVSSTNTLICNTSFTDIFAQSTSSTAYVTSLPAVISLSQSTLHVSGCDFIGNNISAVKALASNITVSGDLTFSNNKALAGTAFILIQDSILTSAENSHIYFLNNHATNIGGVFYITGNSKHMDVQNFPHVYSRSTCFLNTEGSRSCTRFSFTNNSAEIGGNILYGGQVAFGLDGKWNCLESFKNISNISQNGLSLISSDPSRVCLCTITGQYDCLVFVDPTLHTVYPGQTISISAVVVGQDFGTVAGSAYAQFLQGGNVPRLKSDQNVQSVAQHNCNNLYYTIFSQSQVSEAVLVLTAQESFVSQFLNDKVDHFTLTEMMDYYKTNAHALGPLLYDTMPVYVNVSLLPCPPGFMLTTDSPFMCDCDQLLQKMRDIHCHIQEQTIGRSGLVWVGMIQDDNGTNGTVAVSEYCPLDYCNTEDSNVRLSEPDSQCNYNHSGTLCGGCQPGLSLALGSKQCLQCSNKYLALLTPLAMAGPVLVFSIKVLDLTISQGTLNGLIFYANVAKASEYIFFPPGEVNPLTVFIAWLNLDLGVKTCLFQGLTAYSETWLQFVFPFYIWSIAGLIIILARYSDRVAKVMGNNSVPVLATLFLLSHAKLLRTIITALSYTVVYTSHGPKAVWTADGNVDYLSPQHAVLFTTAVAVLLFLWLPYTLLLFLGQWLHRCNCQLVVRMLMKIKPFLDAHYGPLKSKHRYWFGALLLVRATILLVSALTPANRSSVVVLCISVIAAVLTHFGHLVYRNLAVAMFDIAYFMNLALLSGAYTFIATAGGDLAASTYTLVGIAFVQFVGLVLFKAFCILKQNISEKVMRCFHNERQVENDWELYELAALQRGMEPDAEEQDSEGSGSIESLPTYCTNTV